MEATHTLAAILLSIAFSCTCTAAPGEFRLHGRYQGLGGCLKVVVGPGPEPGSERVYASHIYGPEELDIIAIDPETGDTDVFPSAVPSEVGAWAMVLGPDGNVYIGTLSAAHVQRVDWRKKALVDMGRPSQTEQYIWQLVVGADKKLYGCTYPGAKIVRFDPATGKGEDLGRMDDSELYARQIAASNDGFVYTGIGPGMMHLAAYEIATGERRDILPDDFRKPGFVAVHKGSDGEIYAGAGGQWFRLKGWTAEPVNAADVRWEAPLSLKDGTLVSYADGKLTLTDPASGEKRTVDSGYKGKDKAVFRLAMGPDGKLYGSTAMPIHFFWADPESETWGEIGLAGGGEFYSFIPWEDKLVGAAYGGDAPLMIYKPGQPWEPKDDPSGNPWRIHYEGENGGWRPQALIPGDGEVYAGAVSGYGLLGGPIVVLNPKSGNVEQFMHVVQDQSVVALATLPDGTVVGGTTIAGGGGSHPTQTEAKLVLWDPKTRAKTFDTVPVPGEGTITALAVGPDGLVYGFADASMFIFDPKTKQVIHSVPHGLGGVIYNAVAPGPGGELYGLSSGGVFTIDRATKQAKVIAAYPGGIHAGFAIRGNRIFFASQAQIVSYEIP